MQLSGVLDALAHADHVCWVRDGLAHGETMVVAEPVRGWSSWPTCSPGPAWRLLRPCDLERLPPETAAEAALRTHPTVLTGGGGPSPSCVAAGEGRTSRRAGPDRAGRHHGPGQHLDLTSPDRRFLHPPRRPRPPDPA